MSGAAQVTGLVKVFGGTRAVDGLDLSIPHGSFYGIAGPNGAGKSTAIRMLVGLLQPDAGSACVDGMDVWPDPLQAKAVLGYVPDNPVLFDRLSGQEMLEYAGLLRGMEREVIRQRSQELIRVLDLEGASDKMIADYSLGMVLGKALAALIVVLPVMAVFVVVEAVLTARWDEAFAALLAGLNVALAGVGLGAVISVMAPQNQVHPGGTKLRALAGVLAGSVLLLTLVGLLVLAWMLAGDSLGAPLSMLATLPVSALLGWLLLHWAGGRLAANPWRVERALMGT